MDAKIERLAKTGCTLGEGPVWRQETGELWFTDIIGRCLLRWREQDGISRVDMGCRIGAFVPIEDGNAGKNAVVAAAECGVWRFEVDFDGGVAQRVSLGFDEAISAEALMNDGCCDADGRFVFGSKALDETAPIGRMMRFDGSVVETLDEEYVVFNGPAFSPEGDRIWFADSPQKIIRTASYDPATGAMGQIETFAQLAEDAGYPDGMAVDAEGCLWNAHWDGWRLTRYNPDGSIDRVVETPVSRPTSLAFGGPDLSTLFITSAVCGREDAPESGATEDGAGDLYALEAGVAGAPVGGFVPNRR